MTGTSKPRTQTWPGIKPRLYRADGSPRPVGVLGFPVETQPFAILSKRRFCLASFTPPVLEMGNQPGRTPGLSWKSPLRRFQG